MTVVVVAPDKFKGSLTAREASESIALGLTGARPDIEVRQVPVADGGEGTLDVALAAGFERRTSVVAGPQGGMLRADFAVKGSTAVVELAQASGLALVPTPALDPLAATSLGTGQLVVAALEEGCRDIIIAVGGSACTDGGSGLLQALGAQLLDGRGAPIQQGGAALESLHTVDFSTMHPALRESRIRVACDVDNPLLGPQGTALVYAPQKGAGPSDVVRLERALRIWADTVTVAVGHDWRDVPGAGAAGGVGFACWAALGAHLVPGIAIVLELVDFPRRLVGADLVVTGEGSLDAQTLHGKVPAGVAAAAGDKAVPVVAVGGISTLSPEHRRALGLDAVYALADLEPDRMASMSNARSLLQEVGARIAAEYCAEPRRVPD